MLVGQLPVCKEPVDLLLIWVLADCLPVLSLTLELPLPLTATEAAATPPLLAVLPAYNKFSHSGQVK